jgi:uroporphyrinogen decarboxylase
MNGLQRILTALKREEPDRVPIWELIINEPVIKALHGDISYEDFVEKEDLDGITAMTDSKKKWIDSNTYYNEWGMLLRVEPSGLSYIIEGPIKTEKDLDNYKPPDPEAPWRLNSLKRIIDRFKGKKAIIFLGHGAFEYSWSLLGGMDKLFINYIKNPGFVKRISEVTWSYQSKLLENVCRAGVDILLTGDDFAGKMGPLMSPNHFRKFILPYLKKAVDIAKKYDIPFIKHTDGNIWKIIDMIVNSGINGLHPIEPLAGMNIGEVKEKYSDKICLVGNVDCSELLPNGTKQDIIEAVKETIAKASPGGGHIITSSNSIHPAVKPENYKYMIEAVRKYGRYPLDSKMVEEYRKKNYINRFIK